MVFPFLSRFTANGLKPSQKRKVLPVGFSTPMSDTERFARFLRSEELARQAQASGLETFEEADDFDVEDDIAPMPDAPWAEDFDRAYAGAVHGGLASPPDLDKAHLAKNAIFKRKSKSSAPTPPEGKGESADEPLGQQTEGNS